MKVGNIFGKDIEDIYTEARYVAVIHQERVAVDLAAKYFSQYRPDTLSSELGISLAEAGRLIRGEPVLQTRTLFIVLAFTGRMA